MTAPFFAGDQFSDGHRVHVFRSANHYAAYLAVHAVSLKPLRECTGPKLSITPDHRYETDPAVEAIEAELNARAVADTAVVETQPPSLPIPDTVAVRVINGVAKRRYTLAGVTKWLHCGQPISILHAATPVPARVTELGAGYIVVEIERCAVYRRPVSRRVDMTRADIGLGFNKVVTGDQPCAAN